MAVIREDTEVVERPVVARSTYSPATSIIYTLLGILEALLALRFVFRLLGAHVVGFTKFLYDLTEPFVSPFYGIFNQPVINAADITSVFDTAALVAILVYGLIAWAITRLIVAANGRPVV